MNESKERRTLVAKCVYTMSHCLDDVSFAGLTHVTPPQELSSLHLVSTGRLLPDKDIGRRHLCYTPFL